MGQNHNRTTSFLISRRTIIESLVVKVRDELTPQHFLILDGLIETAVNSFTMRTKMGIMNPSARVKELRHMGFNIVTEMKPLKKPDGTITDFAFYTLKVSN